ncbi:MAG: hypothetical protein CMQ35_00055, partial [Gammaproteobacteria bacterium]|nr:hypothetical protein [Gammaproteobacteria bacterium]
AEQWNYRWTSAYGSKDWSVKNPKMNGRDPVIIKSARMLPDGRSVFLKIAKVQPVNSMAIKYNLDTSAGKIFKGTFHITINKEGSALE